MYICIYVCIILYIYMYIYIDVCVCVCMYVWFSFPDIQYLFGASKISNFWTSTVSCESLNLQTVLKPCSHDPWGHLYPYLNLLNKVLRMPKYVSAQVVMRFECPSALRVPECLKCSNALNDLSVPLEWPSALWVLFE